MCHFLQIRKRGGPSRITAFTRVSYWGKTNEKIKAASCSFELHLLLNNIVVSPKAFKTPPANWSATSSNNPTGQPGMKERWQQVTENLVIMTTGFRSVRVQDFINSLPSSVPLYSSQSPVQSQAGIKSAKASPKRGPGRGWEKLGPPVSAYSCSRKDIPFKSSPVSSMHPGEQVSSISAPISYHKKSLAGQFNSWMIEVSEGRT